MTNPTSPGLEGITLATWLWQTLHADAALATAIGVTLGEAMDNQIGEGVAPSDSDPAKPWITFTILPPRDIKVVGLIQVMAETEFQVRCSVQGNSYNPLIPVYQRVHQLLERQTFQAPTGSDGTVLTVGRVSGVQFPEDTQGIQYRHLGGLFQTYVQ